ncbi:hypothetical protein RHGRI_006285 [Rhododendron griersonianum]|uniref:Uncharacterized protein n=1 Tax=Rhododendron griersonianum TaxID=479676 RepID=A0AAV6KSY8_9ERIC|nr:hypothetical protein RHGRI_006285 [Rhododendron griersonianum]
MLGFLQSRTNVHSTSSTSGTPADAANAKQNTEDQNATSSLCCIPISTATGETPAESKNISRHFALLLVNEIENDVDREMKANDYLNDYRTRVTKKIKELLEKKIEEPLENKIEEAFKTVKILADSLIPSDDRPAEDPIETDVQEDIIELKKDVNNIRLQILSELKPLIPTSKAHPHRNHRTNESTHERRKSKNLDKKVPNLCKNETLARSSEFKGFKELYDDLGNKQKLCLLCFSVFPEKVIIKKRICDTVVTSLAGFIWGNKRVIFDPYKNRRQNVSDIAFYTGPIRAMSYVEPYLPDRVLRQFGLLQRIPADPIAPQRASRGQHTYHVVYEWTEGFWSSPDYHLVHEDKRERTPPGIPLACTYDYIPWLSVFSH